jgi:hypothetical protein
MLGGKEQEPLLRKTMENQLQPLQVPLGNFSAEMIKLGLMSTQLWCNGSTLGSLTYSHFLTVFIYIITYSLLLYFHLQ